MAQRKTVIATAVTAALVVASGLLLVKQKKKRQFLLKQKNFTKLRFDLSPDNILAEAKEIVAYWESVEDEIAVCTDITYEKTAGRLANLEKELATRLSNVRFIGYVGENKAVRDASTAAMEIISNYSARSDMREDVYAVIKKLHISVGAKLQGEKKRFVDVLVRDYERNGLHLAAEVKQQVLKYKQEMSKLSIQYAKQSNEENTELLFKKEDLRGLSQDVIDTLKKTDDGKLKVTLKYPVVFPILKTCEIPETRRRIERAFNRRNIDTNVKIIQELATLRSKVAHLLEYNSHSEYILDIRMAKTPKTVDTFLHELNDKLHPLAKKELDALLRLKEADCASSGLKFDGVINMWDFRYYMNEYEKQHCSIDHSEIQQYFPLSHVTKELLNMYEILLSLKFTEVQSPHVWHKDVQMFSVHDARASRKDVDTNRLIGYFYLDLFPRDGKYGHAACHGLQPSCLDQDSKRQVAVASMVANFSVATSTKPSLLSHSEVETYFHEFGHVMHQICSEVELRRFSGTAVERDFVEAPSQMLENWCWEKESLQRLTSHYETKQPLPDTLLDRLISSRNANQALLTKRQLLFALFDQHLHTKQNINIVEVLKQLHEDILLIPMTPETNLAASFGHIAGGYDAQYYGYLWSQVYSMDMFVSKFQANGVMNTKIGLEYREKILAKGGSVDAIDLLTDFLGRAPTDIAFLDSLGLSDA